MRSTTRVSLIRLNQAAQSLSPALVHSDSQKWSHALDMSLSPEQTLALLHQRVVTSNPLVVPLYWGVQCWRQVSWQPVYLAVAAVHCAGTVPPLTMIKQRLQGNSLFHYDLQVGDWQSGKLSTRIEFAGVQLRQLAADWLEIFSGFAKLGSKNARMLLADALNHSLALLAAHGKPVKEILAYNQDWLQAAGMSQCRGLTAGVNEMVIVQRNGCCLDYKKLQGTVCGNCPKKCREKR